MNIIILAFFFKEPIYCHLHKFVTAIYIYTYTFLCLIIAMYGLLYFPYYI